MGRHDYQQVFFGFRNQIINTRSGQWKWFSDSMFGFIMTTESIFRTICLLTLCTLKFCNSYLKRENENRF